MSAPLSAPDDVHDLLAQTHYDRSIEAAAVAALCEGVSLRSAARRWGVALSNVYRTLARVQQTRSPADDAPQGDDELSALEK